MAQLRPAVGCLLQVGRTVLGKSRGKNASCVQEITESRLSGVEGKLNRLTGPAIVQIMLKHTILYLTERLLRDNK